ncbi:MAG: PilN domain-containing protein [Pseudohongiellaceae bacterium]
MKQQVNLYLSEFRVKRDNLTLVLMLQILGLAVGLTVVLSAADFWRNYRLNTELATLREQLAVESRRTAEIDATLARRSQDGALNERLEAAEDVLNASRQVRDFFSARTGGNAAGFSEFFKDLSRASIDGLWITNFSLEGGGNSVVLSGFTIDSSLVPSFVDRLGDGTSPLANKRFSFSTSLSPGNNLLYAFELTTNR